MSPNTPVEITQAEALEYKRLCEEMDAELSDLRILYENTIEHGVAVEDELAEKNDELVAVQKRLRAELDEATNYARSILPEPLEGPGFPQAKWMFVPSTELGGDAFGYHWIDDDHFAIYLLDVCGHGVGAALLSVTAINLLRSGSLQRTDFCNPGQVLSALNEAFLMEKQNGMYFTIWYGVWNKNTRVLDYSSGGHPPALLFPPENAKLVPLKTPQMVIGGMPGQKYKSQNVVIPPGSRLWVFSDGVYELQIKGGGAMLDMDAFRVMTSEMSAAGGLTMEKMLVTLQELQGGESFEDDFSLVDIWF